jgi:hypothetical protein
MEADCQGVDLPYRPGLREEDSRLDQAKSRELVDLKLGRDGGDTYGDVDDVTIKEANHKVETALKRQSQKL